MLIKSDMLYLNQFCQTTLKDIYTFYIPHEVLFLIDAVHFGEVSGITLIESFFFL
jgi:hypothetical protein